MRNGAKNGNPARPAVPLYEYAVRLLILFLAQTGFYFCFVTEYRLSGGIAPYLVTLAFCLIYLVIFSLKSSAVLFAVSVALSGLFIWFHADELVQSWLMLIRDLFSACGGKLPELLATLLHEEGASVFYALCTLMFISTILASYAVTKGDSLLLLTAASVPCLFPGLFFSLSGNTASFFAILAAWFAFSIFRRYGGLLSASVSEDTELSLKVRLDRIRKRPSLRAMAALTAVIMAFSVFGVSSLILPEKGYEKPDIWNRIRESVYESKLGDLIGRPNDGLSHGRFRDLSEIRFTGATALKARVSERLSLYIRNFAGTVYTDDGWEEVPAQTYESYVIGTNPLLLHAEAERILGNGEQRYLFSLKSDRKQISSLVLPQGLLTGTDDLNGTRYRNDTGIDTDGGAGISGYSVYALQLRNAFANIPVSASADPTDAIMEGYAAVIKNRFGKSSVYDDISHYLRYIFDYYTQLPEDTAKCGKALCEQFGITDVTDSGTLNPAAVCSSLQRVFNEYCSYSYDPPAIPADADFSTYFMNQSRQGYCIHFATTAAVMLRSLGIPARYAEGYIIVQSDYLKDTDEEGYFDIEDTHAHAWVEVFDPLQLEWIPVEMTPNEGNDAAAGGLAPTLTPPPTATPEPADTHEPEDQPEEEGLTPEPDATPEPEATGEPDDELSPEEETDTEPDPEGEVPGQETAEPGPDGEPVTEHGEGGTGADIILPGAGTAGSPGVCKSVRSAVIRILVLLLTAGATAAAYLFNRRKRQERLYGDPERSVLYAAKECDAMIRLAGGSSIRPDEVPEEYAERIRTELPWIDGQDILAVYGAAERTMFSSRQVRTADRDRVLKAYGNLRGSVRNHAGLPRRIWIALRYPAVSEPKP
ncbi:MAG: hypothetical protein IJJ92_00895 [Clostridia bacterium]|nr:hypothetical protein [Clostridia bacterium]